MAWPSLAHFEVLRALRHRLRLGERRHFGARRDVEGADSAAPGGGAGTDRSGDVAGPGAGPGDGAGAPAGDAELARGEANGSGGASGLGATSYKKLVSYKSK